MCSYQGLGLVHDILNSLAKASVTTETHALELDINGETIKGQTMYLINIDVNEPKDKFTFRIDA